MRFGRFQSGDQLVIGTELLGMGRKAAIPEQHFLSSGFLLLLLLL